MFSIILEDERSYLKRYCPSSNVNDKYTILSPLPMTTIEVIYDVLIGF